MHMNTPPLARLPRWLDTGLWSIPDAPELYLWKDFTDTIHKGNWYVVSFPDKTPARHSARHVRYMGPYRTHHDAYSALRILTNKATAGA